jgi:hypothetical protein
MIQNIKNSYKVGKFIKNKKTIKTLEIYGYANLDKIQIEEMELWSLVH